ncbi:MAG: hypothetical protein H6922_01825 [Pseudomonadaceae bacterium]|nr:hypothetical protein [Pseudomonadaceae bacterium]
MFVEVLEMPDVREVWEDFEHFVRNYAETFGEVEKILAYRDKAWAALETGDASLMLEVRDFLNWDDWIAEAYLRVRGQSNEACRCTENEIICEMVDVMAKGGVVQWLGGLLDIERDAENSGDGELMLQVAEDLPNKRRQIGFLMERFHLYVNGDATMVRDANGIKLPTWELEKVSDALVDMLHGREGEPDVAALDAVLAPYAAFWQRRGVWGKMACKVEHGRDC